MSMESGIRHVAVLSVVGGHVTRYVGGGLFDAVLWHPAGWLGCYVVFEASDHSQVNLPQTALSH